LLKYFLLIIYILLLSILSITFFDLTWWLDNLSNLILIWITLLIVATPFLILYFKRYAFILCMPALVLICFHLIPNFYSKASSSEEGVKQYHFLQVNLSYYNLHLVNFFSMTDNLNTDFIFLFEFSDRNREQFKKFANGKYMYGYEEIQGFPSGIAVISKYPIVYSHLHRSKEKSSDILELKFYDKQINKIIHSFLLHPPSPRTNHNWHTRNNLLLKLKSLVKANSSDHSLIAGDLNVSPWSYQFPKFKNFTPCYFGSKYLTSWRLKNKYPKKLITSFIDHCFYNDGFKMMSYKHIQIKGSDHMALVYQLQLVVK